MAILSLRGYARHRGVGLSTVQKAIGSGRITPMADGRIDSDHADREWASNTEARPVGSRRPPRDEEDAFGAAQYTKARAVREHYQARLSKLEYEEKVGSLIQSCEPARRCLLIWLVRKKSWVTSGPVACHASGTPSADPVNSYMMSGRSPLPTTTLFRSVSFSKSRNARSLRKTAGV